MARRVMFIASEVRGSFPAGGTGTATSFLALALARSGHSIEVLHFGVHATGEIDPEWARIYHDGGVRVRFLARGVEEVSPRQFARMREVEAALRDDPPDVVIVQDTSGVAYTTLRSRSLGLDFERTLFVVYCHGTSAWIKQGNRTLRVFAPTIVTGLSEQASAELADVVISPSAFLLRWMRGRGWRLPDETRVIPYVTRTGALGGPNPAEHAVASGRVERITFFGRLEPRKGIRQFVAALNALEPELLDQVEIDFVGGDHPYTAEQVRTLIVARTAEAARRISFHTSFEQRQAIAHLRRPGSLVVMPSLLDNSPNTVYECLEHGIPFLAGDVGGAAELVAEEDRERVLCEPSVEGIAEALRRALVDPGMSLRPARAAFDDAESLRRWEEVLALVPRRVGGGVVRRPRVEVVVVYRGSEAGLSRCLGALAGQREVDIRVSVVMAGEGVPEPASVPVGLRLVRSVCSSVEGARADALSRLQGEWVVFLDQDDVPEPELVGTLVRAQEASGADVVSCGLYLAGEDGGRRVHLFAGEPRALGLLANGYGTVALLRRSLLDGRPSTWPVEDDPDWLLLARLSVEGATIVSVPVPLVTRRSPPGSVERSPSDALLVVEELERLLPAQLASTARLAAGLAADAQRRPSPPAGLARRIANVVQAHGVRGAVRRVAERVLPTSG
jgi:glycosyltransferase involved in cell wall biosynthesis